MAHKAPPAIRADQIADPHCLTATFAVPLRGDAGRVLQKLESLDLVERQAGAQDRRVREAVIAPKGKAMTDAVDAARERIGRTIFASWDPHEIDELIRLMRKFADAVDGEPPAAASAIDPA